MAAQWRAAGPYHGSIGDIAPGLPTGWQVGDIFLLYAENNHVDTVLATPTGWTPVADSPQTAVGLRRLMVFWRRSESGDEAPTLVDTGNHQSGIIHAFSGCVASGDPWDVTSGGNEATSDTSLAATGDTTTQDNTLVVIAATHGVDGQSGTPQWTDWANADLGSVTERSDDSTNAAGGGGIGVATGTKAAAGSYGNTTATLANASGKTFHTIALKSAAGLSGTIGQATETDTALAVTSPGRIGIATETDEALAFTPLVPAPVATEDVPVLLPKRGREFHFVIDGSSVDPDTDRGFEMNKVLEGGADQARIAIPERQARRGGFDQGSVLSIYIDNSLTPIWEGRLPRLPQFADGFAHVSALGHKAALEKENKSLLFQTRDYSLWVPLDSDPLNYTKSELAGRQRFDLKTDGGRLLWRLPKDTNFSVGDREGAGLWLKGQDITRIAFTMMKEADNGNFDIQVLRADGPSGSLTEDVDYTLGVGNPDGSAKDRTLSDGTHDLIALTVQCVSGTTIGAHERFSLEKLRVNGIAPDDEFTTTEVARAVFDLAGMIPSLIESALNALPLFWESGSRAELLQYMSELDDTVWQVTHEKGGRPIAERFAWGTRRWTVARSDGANVEGLDPQEIINEVVVHYDTPGGSPEEYTLRASPDPLVRDGIVNTLDYDLEDPQPNEDLATAVAERLLEHHSRQLYAGPMDVFKAYDEAGRNAPEEIRPGDILEVTDFDQLRSVDLPVHEAELTDEGVVRIGIEQAVTVANLLRQAASPGARRRRRRRRRRKRNRR